MYHTKTCITVLFLFIFVVTGCKGQDNNAPVIKEIQPIQPAINDNTRHISLQLYTDDMERNQSLRLVVGDKVKLQSDTALFKEPSFASATSEYLQLADLEIEAFAGHFAKVKTLNFLVTKTGWVPLWSLVPESEDMQFYRGDRLKLSRRETTLRGMPAWGQDISEGIEIRLHGHQPVQVLRMFRDYFEVSFIDMDGTGYSQLWVKQEELMPFDPALSRQGLIHPDADFVYYQDLHEEDKVSIPVWITRRSDEQIEIRLPDGEQAVVKSEDIILDPFGSTSLYGDVYENMLLWYEHYPPEDRNEPLIFRLNANRALDRKSVEDTVRNSLNISEARNAFDASKLNVHLEFAWISDRDLYLFIRGLRLYDAVEFRLNDAYAKDGTRLGNVIEPSELVFRASLIAENEKVIHKSETADLLTESKRLPAFLDYRLIETAEGGTRLVFYTFEKHWIFNWDAFEMETFDTLSTLMDRNDYAYPELIGERWSEDLLYLVAGTKELYAYRYKEGTADLLYASDNPIYNLSVSPDRQKIALLISTEDFAVYSANLIVLDTQGRVMMKAENAAVLYHSDGIYSIYPMRWISNDTVAADTYYTLPDEPENRFGERHIHISSGQSILRAKPSAEWDESRTRLRLMPDDIDLPVNGIWRDILTPNPDNPPIEYYKAPDGKKIMIYVNGQLILYNTEDKQFRWVGSGHFVRWADANAFIWIQGYYPFVRV